MMRHAGRSVRQSHPSAAPIQPSCHLCRPTMPLCLYSETHLILHAGWGGITHTPHSSLLAAPSKQRVSKQLFCTYIRALLGHRRLGCKFQTRFCPKVCLAENNRLPFWMGFCRRSALTLARKYSWVLLAPRALVLLEYILGLPLLQVKIH